jgi:hypothetical protein
MSVHRSFELPPRAPIVVPSEVEDAVIKHLWIAGTYQGKPNFVYDPNDFVNSGEGSGFASNLPGREERYVRANADLTDSIRAAQIIAQGDPSNGNGTVAVVQAADGTNWLTGTYAQGMDFPIDEYPSYPPNWHIDDVVVEGSPNLKALVSRETVLRLENGRGELRRGISTGASEETAQ